MEQILEQEKWMKNAKAVNIGVIATSLAAYALIVITELMEAYEVQFLISIIYLLAAVVLAIFAIIVAMKLKGQNVQGLLLMVSSAIILAVFAISGFSFFLVSLFLSGLSLKKLKETQDEMVLREKVKMQKAQAIVAEDVTEQAVDAVVPEMDTEDIIPEAVVQDAPIDAVVVESTVEETENGNESK